MIQPLLEHSLRLAGYRTRALALLARLGRPAVAVDLPGFR